MNPSFSPAPRRTRSRTAALCLSSLAALTLVATGCESGQVEVAEAQSSEAAVPDTIPAPTPEVVGPDSIILAANTPEPEVAETPAAAAPAPARSYRAGEDPDFAAKMGWPVKMPEALPGAILPSNRIVCYYGNPNSTRMGALGEFPKDDMLRRLRNQIAEWEKADPATPVKPCLHMVAVVAQGEPGTSGKYRAIMLDRDVQKVYDWAREVDGIFIVDIQVGTDNIRNILPRFEWILKNPDVHLGIDPEFYMKGGQRPGSKIGTMDAADINYASEYLAKLVREHNLPPKTFVVHRFTRNMVTNSQQIRLRPEVQIVMHMDGWGAPWLKRDSYRDYVVREPVQYTGFKLFYHNDTKKGDPLMSPEEMLLLEPKPVYIQYQ
ncbi:lipoprotein [soil metagenome]